MSLIDELLQDAREHMDKSVEATRGKFGSVRTGRASPALLDRISVDYYGTQTPLKQLATINAPEARLLTVQPYDKSSMKAIERAILESDIGLTPNNDGAIIRLQIPELTEERRKELVKVVRRIAEEGRMAIRNIRRDVMHDLRELREAGEAGQDDEHRAEERCRSSPTRRSPSSTASSRARKTRSSRCDTPGRHVRRDHHRRERALGQPARPAGRRRSPGRARTRSRRGCATRSTSGSRS